MSKVISLPDLDIATKRLEKAEQRQRIKEQEKELQAQRREQRLARVVKKRIVKLSPHYFEIKLRAIELLQSGEVICHGQNFQQLRNEGGWPLDDCVRFALHVAQTDVMRPKSELFHDSSEMKEARFNKGKNSYGAKMRRWDEENRFTNKEFYKAKSEIIRHLKEEKK